MLFFSYKLRLYCANLLSLCLFLSFPAQADSQKITEVAGVKLTPQGQVVAQKIKRVFYDAPYMLYVANCESTGLIHRENSGLIISRADGIGEGVFQVQMSVHRDDMKKMKLDPSKLDQYFMFVRHLYDTRGLQPWNSSKKCWEKYVRSQKRG